MDLIDYAVFLAWSHGSHVEAIGYPSVRDLECLVLLFELARSCYISYSRVDGGGRHDVSDICSCVVFDVERVSQIITRIGCGFVDDESDVDIGRLGTG